MQKTYGVCLGASTISIAERTAHGFACSRTTHDGRVMGVLNEFFSASLPAIPGFTGRKFKKLITIPTVSEPEAVELAYRQIQPQYPGIDCIVSAGGETFLVYMLDSKGNIRGVHTGNKCASGTGEFFFQQIKRMELDIVEAVDRAAESESYPVAGRCSVFCKRDCTHALNKGKDKGEVAAGLCRMMAGKIIELLQKAQAKKILMVGGVSSNRVVVDYIRESYPDIVVPEEALYFEALGALLWAEEHGSVVTDKESLVASAYHSFSTFPALKETGAGVTFKSAHVVSFLTVTMCSDSMSAAPPRKLYCCGPTPMPLQPVSICAPTVTRLPPAGSVTGRFLIRRRSEKIYLLSASG